MSRMDGETTPNRSQFGQIAATRRVVPVVRRLLADGRTPVDLYRSLTGGAPGTFLLESAENGQSWSRYSFIGVRCDAMLTEVDGIACWVGHAPLNLQAVVESAADPLAAMREVLRLLHSERIGTLPPLTSGLVGMISYDAVRRWERLPDGNSDELKLPEIAMLLATDVAVYDHFDNSVLLISNAYLPENVGAEEADAAFATAQEHLNVMMRQLAQPSSASLSALDTPPRADVQGNVSAAEYYDRVEAAREHIYSGDAFQIVISARFTRPATASAFDIYRVLRVSNPSPYMYLFRFPHSNPAGLEVESDSAFDIVGSSPEALVKLTAGRAMMHPIAGTRPRGATPDADQQNADDLTADEKERAEHLMLVDLGRNDLGRVCKSGSVEVVEFMEIERYSHVMHIVSTVVGELSSSATAYDLLAATFPAGTLSGAPKPKAMEIIDNLETTRRGLYGGAVGYLDFAGDMDTAIAIRTAVLRNGTAYVQAGAGLVADSDPKAEFEECHNKAAAVLRAIEAAATLREVKP